MCKCDRKPLLFCKVYARLAQLVRSLTANQEVPGFNPPPGRGLNFG